MVDPKRHINILSPKEQSFIEECENEFANRFTDLDDEFKAHCQQPAPPPPIMYPWNVRRNHGGPWRGGGGSGSTRHPYYNNRGYNRNNYRGGGRDRHGAPYDSRSRYGSDERRYEREAHR